MCKKISCRANKLFICIDNPVNRYNIIIWMNRLTEYISKLFSNLVFLLITPFLAILLTLLFIFPGYKNYVRRRSGIFLTARFSPAGFY